MKIYRLLPVRETGFVVGPPREFQAENDSEAFRRVCNMPEGDAFELWLGFRYIATVTRNPVSQHPDWIVVTRS